MESVRVHGIPKPRPQALLCCGHLRGVSMQAGVHGELAVCAGQCTGGWRQGTRRTVPPLCGVFRLVGKVNLKQSVYQMRARDCGMYYEGRRSWGGLLLKVWAAEKQRGSD